MISLLKLYTHIIPRYCLFYKKIWREYGGEIVVQLLFTPFSATRFAMQKNMNLHAQSPRSIVCFANSIYANRINSRGMSRVFCDLRAQKTPRGILSMNSNVVHLLCIAFLRPPQRTYLIRLKYWKNRKKELYGLIMGGNVNHHKIYNIYAKNNVFFYVSRETLCGMIKIKVL